MVTLDDLQEFEYRGWEGYANADALPGWEYTYHHRDYQGSASDDPDDRWGRASSVEACKIAIDRWHEANPDALHLEQEIKP